MSNCNELFGSMVFSDAVMREKLPREVYAAMRNAISRGERLDINLANVVATAMKDWAISRGATHFTHWFQPMTGITAGKHDSFLTPLTDGRAIMEFSGKELVRGESDASSFPSGGLRATFEARGYTAWDPTSYAFVKDRTLYIPTAFCSYGGEALDKKTPLLRSMEALQKQALRVLRLMGHSDVRAVRTTVGAEQEYFLIDRTLYERRPDLMYTGRTLLGARSPKGQELDDHYFGSIKPRVKAYMEELDEELWKLGIAAKTEHNEAAPAQHELAPMFTTTNIAADHNQLMMELMQRIAEKHGMVCLLHEKPFAGVNGSGKHNNWSLCTDTGINLLEPGETPFENAQFLLFLSAVIRAVDDYQALLRISVAGAGNDHRLGADEAPPAILSVYLGEELMEILDAIEHDGSYGGREKQNLRIGVHVLPRIPCDSTDRNRTSPFAFTGNKFEFRMLGSSASISDANTILNTAVAEELRRYADALEASDYIKEDIHEIIKAAIRDHRRILFNGNGYDGSWVREAARRGLDNLPSTPDALAHLMDRKNVELFTRHGVFSESEMHARLEIMEENYAKVIAIEAQTLTEMVQKDILPAVSAFTDRLANSVMHQSAVFGQESAAYERRTGERLVALKAQMLEALDHLHEEAAAAAAQTDNAAAAAAYQAHVLPAMEALRIPVDQAEVLVATDYWPYPSYGRLLQGAK